MISIKNDSDTAIIMIHEIYGVNQHINYICGTLSQYGFDVICPNLLAQENAFDYSQEEVAYHNFIENIGFSNAVLKIKDLLVDIKNTYKKVFIVGFSVGATVAWLCSEENTIDGVIGYYGSRIRNYTEINPKCPVLLFFPQKEKSFHVDEVIATLYKKNNVKTHIFEGQHGFSDPYSLQYNEESAKNTFEEMIKFIRYQLKVR
ncbi:dienelactone hydrolase family protein [Microbacteriaceae bacterium 4G12]